MKKLILLTASVLILGIVQARAKHDFYEFPSIVEKKIYQGSLNGSLTQREVNRLNEYINQYQFTLWKLDYRSRLSNREKRRMVEMQEDILRSLNYALNNREVVVRRNKIRDRYNGFSRRERTWNRQQNRGRNGSDMCPAPRNNRPIGRKRN